jgi:undecaprenyl-diphosphatase
MDPKEQIFLQRLLQTLGLFGLGLVGFWAASFLINDAVDRKILLFINPNEYIPFIDELMIAVTDFSMLIFGLSAASWEIGYLIQKYLKNKLPQVVKGLRLFGLFFGIIMITAFWWGGYEYKIIFFPLGIIIIAEYWWMSTIYSTFDGKYLEVLSRVILVTALAGALSPLGEYIVKYIVKRPRPLNPVNDTWNYAIVTRSDEIVKGSYSYYSGHSSGLFAALTPLMWAVKKRSTKALLFAWAALHAFSRIYLAAHFPFCVLIGSLAGFFLGTIVIMVFQVKKESSTVQ